jgi:hypothetical protein
MASEKKRAQDVKRWCSPSLFLSLATTSHINGRLNPKVTKTSWNEVCQPATIEGRTLRGFPHAKGKHLIEKTDNLAAVQCKLRQTIPAYFIQYTQITVRELGNALVVR